MRCPDCDSPDATYQAFSGGREGYCPACDNQFPLSLLPPDQQPRAVLLQTETGRVALRAQMDQELATQRGTHVPECNDGCDGDTHLLLAEPPRGTDLWPLAVAYLVGILTGVAGLWLLLTAVR